MNVKLGIKSRRKMRDFNTDFERHLQDDDFAIAYAEASKTDCRMIQRTIYSRWKRLWRIYYRLMPARFTRI